MPELTLHQLSHYTGEPEERLRDWQARGVIGHDPGDSLTLDDLERVRLVQLFLRRGISLDAVVEAMHSGAFDWFYNFPWRETPGPIYSLAEAAEMTGVTIEAMQGFREAMGSLGPDDFVSEEELALMRGWKLAAGFGVPDQAQFEMIRVYSDSLDRVGEAEQRFYRFYVRSRLEAEELPPQELLAAARRLRINLTHWSSRSSSISTGAAFSEQSVRTVL